MNLRHAVAFALVGWYLMSPPIESCRGAFSGHSCDETPLSKWAIRKTYDSLPRCKATRDWLIERGQRYLKEAADARGNKRVQIDQADYMTWIAAKCVASDDPRLKRK